MSAHCLRYLRPPSAQGRLPSIEAAFAACLEAQRCHGAATGRVNCSVFALWLDYEMVEFETTLTCPRDLELQEAALATLKVRYENSHSPALTGLR